MADCGLSPVKVAIVPPASVDAMLNVDPAVPVELKSVILSESLQTVLYPLPRLVRVLASTLPRKVMGVRASGTWEGASLVHAHRASISNNVSKPLIDNLVIVVLACEAVLEQITRKKQQHFRLRWGICR